MAELFNVVTFFPGGSYEYVRRSIPAKEAVEAAKDYTQRPAALIGAIDRVMITDGGDNAVFDWQFGKGVVFPSRADCAAAAAAEQEG